MPATLAYRAMVGAAGEVPAANRRQRRRRLVGRAARTFGGLLLAAVGGAAALPARAPRLAAAIQLPGPCRRRGVLQLTTAAGLAVPLRPALAEAPKLQSSWTANEGVSFLTSFSEESYGAMRDDTRRTPQFIKAIRQRVSAGRQTVLDIGTGPFALFALVAARAGAKKVYAVEANPEACARARAFVAQADDIKPGTVEIIEGFTTAIDLPEKVDLVCAEIIGAIASEENLLSTIRDAQARFLKNPKDPGSYIPVGVKTYGAPVSYALHPVLTPRFERLKGQPLRVNCRDRTVQLLSDPQLVEDIQFSGNLPGAGTWRSAGTLSYPISESRLAANMEEYFNALMKEDGVTKEEAATLAKTTANSFSGMAFWPKLVLDEAGEIVVESRGPMGEHQKSHWQTLLSLMTAAPLPVKPGDVLKIDEAAEIYRDILSPSKYSLSGQLVVA